MLDAGEHIPGDHVPADLPLGQSRLFSRLQQPFSQFHKPASQFRFLYFSKHPRKKLQKIHLLFSRKWFITI